MPTPARTGLIIMTLAAISFSCTDIGIKVLGENLSPWKIGAARGLAGMMVAVAMAKFRFRAFLVPQWRRQFMLGGACALGFTCLIISLKMLPLSVAMPVSYIFPSLGALMSPFINNEKPSRADWVAIGLAFAAVICFSRGGAVDQAESRSVGLAVGLVGAFFVGLMTNLARRSRAMPLSVNIFYLYLANFALCFPLVLILDSHIIPASVDLAKLFLFIIPTSIAGFGLMFLGYRYMSAHRGGIILTLEVAVATVFGLTVLDEPVTVFVVMGGLLILASAVIIGRAKAE